MHFATAVSEYQLQDVTDVLKARRGEKLAAATREHGFELEVVNLPEAKRGFILLPCREVVERSFARPPALPQARQRL